MDDNCILSEKLHDAVNKNDVTVVQHLINSGVDINVCNKKGVNSLHAASFNGFVDIVKELLQSGCTVDSLTSARLPAKGYTALHLAATNGYSEVVKLLLVAGADVDFTDWLSRSPLHMAARNSHFLAVKLLVENGASVDIRDKDGFTALHYAAVQREVMQSPIHQASLTGQESTVKYLLTLETNTNLYELLEKLILAGKYSMARTILEYKQQRLKSVLGATSSLLFMEAENKNILTDFLIMDLNEEINGLSSDGESVLEVACKYCNLNAIFGLLNYDYDVNIRSTQVVDIVSELNALWDYIYREALMKHCVKLSVVRPDWSWPDAYLSLIDCNDKTFSVKKFEKECELEVVELTAMKIGVSHYTMLDILVGSTDMAFICVSTVGINVIEEMEFHKFPIYGGMVYCKLKRVFRRVMLINMLRNDCPKHTFLLNLPEIPFQKIIRSLSDEDLEMLIKTTHKRVPLCSNISEFVWATLK